MQLKNQSPWSHLIVLSTKLVACFCKTLGIIFVWIFYLKSDCLWDCASCQAKMIIKSMFSMAMHSNFSQTAVKTICYWHHLRSLNFSRGDLFPVGVIDHTSLHYVVSQPDHFLACPTCSPDPFVACRCGPTAHFVACCDDLRMVFVVSIGVFIPA